MVKRKERISSGLLITSDLIMANGIFSLQIICGTTFSMQKMLI